MKGGGVGRRREGERGVHAHTIQMYLGVYLGEVSDADSDLGVSSDLLMG